MLPAKYWVVTSMQIKNKQGNDDLTYQQACDRPFPVDVDPWTKSLK